MFVHVFAFQWIPAASAAQREAACRDVLAFEGVVPGLQQVLLGKNVSANSPEWTTTAVMTFDDRAAFDAYVTHPRHVALLDWLVPLITAIELDFTPMAG